MAILTRADGTPFAIYTYRELITAKKASLLKNELMLLSRDNGEYARFFDKSGGDFEAVFGHEEGYLLGENVWHYFGQPDDLIFCEQQPDNEHAILVIVRGGNVFIDAKMPLANLLDEFLGLIAGDNRFDIYVYGDLIPLASTAQEDKFAFDPNLVSAFTQLEAPLFEVLPLDESFRLIPINKAIGELGLSENNALKWGVSLVVLAALVFGIFKTLQETTPTVEKPVEVEQQAPVDPYLSYREALSTPNPAAVIKAAVNATQQLLTIPGWTPVNLALDSSLRSANITLSVDGGDTGTLLAWARQHNLDVSIGGAEPVLSIPLQVKDRQSPQQIYKLQDTASLLYDDLKRILPSGNVTLGAATSLGSYGSMTLSLTFQDAGQSELYLLAQSIRAFPVEINSLTFTIDRGVISGSINLTVYGVN